jgi:aminocarboxymuconate-semialdehyde decarboxylase
VLHPFDVARPPALQEFYLENSIGNPLDTCVAAARLLFSGTLERYHELKLVLAHGGGFLPYQLGRMQRAFEARSEARERTMAAPTENLRRFWVDSITHSDKALAFLVGVIGEDRVMLGTDLPFDMADRDAPRRLRELGLNHSDKVAVRLFGL